MILEQLYGGNIGPAHLKPYETVHSKHYSEKADKLEQELEAKLDEHGRRLLRQLQETENAADSAFSIGCFVHGFKIAALMMAEVFMDSERELISPERYWNGKVPPRERASAETE